ncbi:MAG: response regulator transcription factor [Chloroflexota bacterium]|nr:response regulator transcription factor [Chloroflexota bacterium]
MGSSHTVLLVEGRKPAGERLAPILDEEYDLVTARTRREALTKIGEAQPAVIVLDSPSLRFSRRRFCDTLDDDRICIPVLLLYKGSEAPKEIGARAYLRHPFSSQKLINRISWLLPAGDGELLKRGELTLNVKRRSVTRGDRESHLTPKQAQLLELFMRHPGEILTREFLMKRVWETDFTDDTRTLDVHIHWVREAIEKNTGSPDYLHTVRGVGYRFTVPKKSGKAH